MNSELSSKKIIYTFDSSPVSHKKHKKRRKCSKHCNKKDCKYCKIFGISPHYVGMQLAIVNDLEAHTTNTKHLYIDGRKINLSDVIPKTIKHYTVDYSTTNKNLYFDNRCITIDDIEGGIVKTIINTKISEIVFNPTFISTSDTQVEISIVGYNKNNNKSKKLARSVGKVFQDCEQTINLIWKGNITSSYTHLLFVVGNTNINIVDDGIPNITVVN